MTAVAPPVVFITSNALPGHIEALLGPGQPIVEAGYGGWSEVARPRQSPLTFWAGSPGLRMTVSLLFEGFGRGANRDESVEPDIANLETLARPGGDRQGPPVVYVKSTGKVIPHQGTPWVIDSLEWGDALLGDNGNRIRQEVTLHLLEYLTERPVSAVPASPANREREARNLGTKGGKTGAKAKRKHAAVAPLSSHIHTPHIAPMMTQLAEGPGEDLLTIAAHELGDAERWRELADLNDIRDPRSIKLGQVIRLP